MIVDPAASMRCWAVELHIGGRAFTIPPLPAADWWPVLSSGDVTDILDLITTEPGGLDEMLLSGEVTGAEVSEAVTDALEAVAGRPVYTATVLAVVASETWATIGGAVAQTGFRWDTAPLGAALDLIHAVLLAHMTDENRKKFVDILNKAPDGKPNEGERRRIATEFETMAGPRPTGGLKSTGAPSDSARPRTRRRPPPPRQDGPSREPTRRRARPAENGPAASS